MREINAAFETLRRAVPHISTSAHQSQNDSIGSEKLTKITTLRLAMKYIASLSQALQQADSFIHMSEVPAPTLQHPNSISSSSNSSNGSLRLISDGESLTFSEQCLTPPDRTPPNFTKQCFTSVSLTRMSSPDHIRHRITPPPENNRQNISSSPEIQRTICNHSQNILSSELGITTHCIPSDSTGNLCDNHPCAGHSRHCLLSPAVDRQCLQHQHPCAPNSQLCLSTPVLQSPDLSQHCLTPVDFEEHAAEEHSALLVFDDDSLDSPDLDHLLIS
ncbi:Helix-loop-helix protein delilah [Zootermopsis nevadensis]|uniref:Helix-loop-helix protein delilah n=2 Tax=Zootermopsis nevadensis TaxID=136037 RepID=A0A067RVP2_ZOONE|nr:Helix-loop-helix protein delilah [Zootermopsis nevadensis]